MKKFLVSVLLLVMIAGFTFAEGKQEKASEDTDKETTYVFKYANTQSQNHPRSKSMEFFKEKIETASNGRIKVELFFNGVLGKEAEVLDMVKLGTVQGCRGGLFERANKQFLIYTLPFMFDNTDEIQKVMFGPIGQEINEGAMANGLYIPATAVAGGPRNITNNVRPIKAVEDLKGLKMRTPPIDMTLKTFKALGANAQQVPYTETYMALKTGVVDGQENPFSNIVDMKFYEAQKYLSILNWQIHPDPFFVNPDWYNSLPNDLKMIFDSVAELTMRYSNEIWLGSEKGYLATLKDNLEVNVVTSSDRAGFVNAVKPVWQGYVDDGIFTWDDINKVIEAAK